MDTQGSGDRPGSTASSHREKRFGWLDPLVLLFLCLQVWIMSPPLLGGGNCSHPDADGHWARAIDCVEGRGCSLSLGRLSRLDLAHGAVFTDLLSGAAALGARPETLPAIVAFFYALALFCLYRIGILVHGRAVGFVSAQLTYLAALVPMSGGLTVIWNPGFLPFPVVLTLGAVVLHARTRRLSTLLLAALFLSISIQTHLAALALSPLLLWQILRLPRRQRLSAALMVAGVGTLTFLLVSPASLAQMRPEFASGSPQPAGPIEMALVFLAALSTLAGLETLRETWARRGQGPRSWQLDLRLGLFLTQFPLLAYAAVLAPSASRYTLSLLPGLSLLVVATLWCSPILIGRPGRSARGLGSLIVAATLLQALGSFYDFQRSYWPPEGPVQNLRPTCIQASDGRALAQLVRSRLGWGFDDVMWRLRGAGDLSLWNATLSYQLPDPPPGQSIADLELAITALPAGNRAALPPGWIDLGPDAPPGQSTFGAYLHRSALRWAEAEVCAPGREALPPGSEATDCRPLPARPRIDLPAAVPPAPYSTRELAAFNFGLPRPRTAFRIRVPLRSAEELPRGTVRLLLEGRCSNGCESRILGATGASLEKISSSEALLGPPSGEEPATLLLELGGGECEFVTLLLPALLEWPAELPADEARSLLPDPRGEKVGTPLPAVTLPAGTDPYDRPWTEGRTHHRLPPPGVPLPYRVPFAYVALLLLLLAAASARLITWFYFPPTTRESSITSASRSVPR